MQVQKNTETVVKVKDYTFTLSPSETETLRNILGRHIDRDGLCWAFAGDLRQAIDASKNDENTDPAAWYGSGKGDQNLRDGRKIYSIRECRQATGCGLREAKDAADARAFSLGV